MALAIFDLDNTLLGGDSDHAWGEFISSRGLVEAKTYRARNDAFAEAYAAGTLDIEEYLNFALELLGQHHDDQLDAWHAEFMTSSIDPIILPAALDLIDKHRQAGDTPMIITATNRFVTAPIARKLGIDILLATECERADGRYTGRTTDVPCFREGKVARLQRWLEENGESLAGSYFYSDSQNDLPLLRMVDHPVAVDPDDTLHAHALAHAWPVISLRG